MPERWRLTRDVVEEIAAYTEGYRDRWLHEWENRDDAHRHNYVYGYVLSADDATLYAENNAREEKRWGKLLEDKRFLQVRGYIVWEDHDRIVVDGRRLTPAQFGKLADRVRRMAPETLGERMEAHGCRTLSGQEFEDRARELIRRENGQT